MNHALLALGKGLIWTALILIAVVEVHIYVTDQINIHTFEEMALRDNCQFLTPSASRRDVGMFQCDGKIVFKRVED